MPSGAIQFGRRNETQLGRTPDRRTHDAGQTLLMPFAAPITLLLLTAGATPEARRQDAIMDRIERAVRLPDGAEPLAAYARYYGISGGRVEAIYVLPSIGLSQGALAAGRRRWVGDVRQLPGISDGGCAVVEVRFDLTAGRIERVACNGVA
jgi:hypothetical protein